MTPEVDPAPTAERDGPPVAAYGPDLPTEADLRLLGDVRGRRVLDLGCGEGRAVVAFALAGATAIGIDPSGDHLAAARALAATHEVRVELRQGDVADLAPLRADSIDAAWAAGTLERVEDLGRVLRQVHRVLKVGAPFVFSLGHPLWAVAVDGQGYFDRGTGSGATPRPIGDLYGALLRASYRVDAVVEPEPLPGGPRSATWDPRMTTVPRLLVVRARKEGS